MNELRLKLDPELADAIRERAKANDRYPSAEVRYALRCWLAADQSPGHVHRCTCGVCWDEDA